MSHAQQFFYSQRATVLQSPLGSRRLFSETHLRREVEEMIGGYSDLERSVNEMVGINPQLIYLLLCKSRIAGKAPRNVN
jgi:hypothetical protein